MMRIKCDGTTNKLQVFIGDKDVTKHLEITSIKIHEMLPQDTVKVTMTCTNVALDVDIFASGVTLMYAGLDDCEHEWRRNGTAHRPYDWCTKCSKTREARTPGEYNMHKELGKAKRRKHGPT